MQTPPCRGFLVEKNMVETEFRPNTAVAEVANYVEKRGKPLVFHKVNVRGFMRRRIRPFSDMLERMSAFERDRIIEEVQRLRFNTDKTYGFTTTGYGR